MFKRRFEAHHIRPAKAAVIASTISGNWVDSMFQNSKSPGAALARANALAKAYGIGSGRACAMALGIALAMASARAWARG